MFVSETPGKVGHDDQEESLKVRRLVKSSLRHADEGLCRYKERPMKAFLKSELGQQNEYNPKHLTILLPLLQGVVPLVTT